MTTGLARFRGEQFYYVAAAAGITVEQTVLVAPRGSHMRLGIFGAAVASLVVVPGAFTIAVAVHLGGHHMPPGARPAVFLASGWVQLAVFAALTGTGLALRRRMAGVLARVTMGALIDRFSYVAAVLFLPLGAALGAVAAVVAPRTPEALARKLARSQLLAGGLPVELRV